MSQPKIFITAYNCSPGKGSEHSCGWNLIYHISKYVPITVLTDAQFIKDFDKSNPLLKNITMVFIKNPFSIRLLNSLEFPIGFYLTYRFWEKCVYRYLRQRFRMGEVELINRITIGSLKEPGYSWKIEVPYIWNEAHVASHVPYRFFGLFTFKTKLVFLILNLHRLFILRSRRCSEAFKRAFYVFATNNETRTLLEKQFDKECGVCYETGTFVKPFPQLRKRNESNPFRIFWAGRIVDFKGLELVIRAAALLPAGTNYELVIAGEGNQKNRLMKLAKKLHVNADFVGLIPYDQMSSLFSGSHCYTITSFKDGMTNAVLESLSNYCPVICLDHLSYGEVINDDIGFKVPVTTVDGIVSDLAQKLLFLYDNEDYRLNLIRNMPEVVRGLTWEENARKVIAVYEKALNRKILGCP